MKKIKWLTLSLLFCCLFSSCFDFPKTNLSNTGNTVRDEAYVPVYSADTAGSRLIAGGPVRETKLAGKIYVQGNLLFQVEKLAGVHVINYADIQKPVKLGFIKSRGCSELAFKNGYLIINNLDDLVFVDVRDPAHVKETARIPHAFTQFYAEQYANSRPPLAGKYYVCPDFYKGDVIGWELKKNVSGAYCSN